ncbi:MAG: bifunctional D-glycero-beta-D-manno-heptose-7-phosphate kinase/D-glycero-beta-D-manno-heptose 1-phosphate adenylyltransferase HldE [Gammaproteobacteria bacterium]|nr:bifunctional D-glycero-beta-D-manno-heptose-7-phosphate kinase/D-glycero-beta-D-manno-heptose 1-phosphate adenylyltransferase HldE [Gammaproteobacteria bacterium]
MPLSDALFSSHRVLVVGDVMLDRYWSGSTDRISPEAPVPVVKISECKNRPGGAANVALNVVALGCQVSLLGLIGDDEQGEALKLSLLSSGLHDELLIEAGAMTISKLRVMSRHQQLIRLDQEDGFKTVDHQRLLRRFQALLPQANLVVLSDYAKGTLDSISSQLIAACQAADVPVLVDPKGGDFSCYAGATLITPNLSEFEAIVGSCKNELELMARADTLMQELSLEALLVTRSEAGMSLFHRGLAPQHLPAEVHEVYDVTGAGDTVIAVLAASLACGFSMADGATLANRAAGLVVAKLGASSVSLAEMRAAFALESAGISRGVVGQEALLLRVAEAKHLGESVVMTNGCFDILHAGHVQYLQQAKALGDRLIVAVNDDASVAALKGAERPLNPLAERMALLAALTCVDWVVAFSGETPEELICAVLPHILVKGGDYRPEQIAGYDCVMQSGGDVRVLAFKNGCSTSSLVEKIRRS